MPNQNSQPKQSAPLGASTKINDCSDVIEVRSKRRVVKLIFFLIRTFQTITVLKHIIDAPIICPPGYALDKNGKCRPIYK